MAANPSEAETPRPSSASTAPRPAPRRSSTVADNAGALGDLVEMIWRKKLWWMLPLILSLLLLAALIVLQATPVGPLLYPVF